MPRKTQKPAGRRAAAPDPTYTPSLGAGQASAGPAPGMARATSFPTRILLEKLVLQREVWKEAAVGGVASHRELLPVSAAVVRSSGARRNVRADLRRRGTILCAGLQFAPRFQEEENQEALTRVHGQLAMGCGRGSRRGGETSSGECRSRWPRLASRIRSRRCSSEESPVFPEFPQSMWEIPRIHERSKTSTRNPQ